MRLNTLLPVATILLAGTAPCAVLAQDVGLVGAVNQTSQGTPPGRPSRMLNLGNNVIFKERIETSKVGSLQVAFVDKSTVSLGPDSNIVLDEYLYDPNGKTGKMLISLGKGALRFVGGEISHQGNVEVRTPAGTVGVRGGAFTLTYDPASKSLRIVSNYGRLTISNAQGTQVISRPGYVSTMTEGAPPSPPQRAGQGDFDRPTNLVGSQPGQNGGAPLPLTDRSVQTGYTNPASQSPPAVVTSQSGNTSQTTTRNSSPPPPPADTQTTSKTIQTAVANKAAATTAVTDVITSSGTDQTAISLLRSDAGVTVAAARQAVVIAQVAQTSAAQLASAAAAAAANASTDPNGAVSRAAALQAAAAAQAALNQASADLARALAALTQVEAVLARLQAATTLAQVSAAAADLVAAANTLLSAVQSVISQNAVAQARALDVNALVAASFQAARVVPARAFALDGVASAGSAFPFLTNVFVSSGNSSQAVTTPMLGYRTEGSVSADGFTVTPGQMRTLIIGFSLNGTGASQSSNAMVATGRFETASPGTGNALEFVGGFFASGRTSAANGPSFAAGAITGSNGTITVDTNSIPTGATVDPDSLAGGIISPSQTGALQYGYLPGNSTPNYTFSQSGTSVSPPAGLGASRGAITLNGYVSGSMTSTQVSSTPGANGLFPLITSTRQDYQFAGLTGTPNDVVLTFDPARSTVRGTIQIRSLDPTSRLESAIYQLGSDSLNEAGRRSTYIDNNTFALRSYNGSASVSSATLRTNAVETIGTGNKQLMFPWSAVVSTNPSASSQFFPGVNMCDCAYTQWGFWSSNGSHASDADWGNLNPWVAGQLANVGQIPNSGSATYNGHAIASINNNGAVYIAGGNFSHAVNFATGTGTGSITNLDGRSYTLSSALSAGTVNFSGTIAGASAAGTLQGSFYGPGTPPAEMGGQFGIAATAGASYLANGVFLGKR